MKIKITERGAHGPAVKKHPQGYEFVVGQVYDVEEIYEHLHNIDDFESVEDERGRLKIPSYLVGKCVVVGEEAPSEMESDEKSAVTNPGLSDAEKERQARLVELSKGLSKEDFTKSGAPNVEAINALLDKNEEMFNADERNKLWPTKEA